MSTPTPSEVGDDVGAPDRTRIGGRLEPLGLDHRQTETVVSIETHVTGRDTDTHGEAFTSRQTVRQIDRLLDRDSGCESIATADERCHDPVAEALDHPAMMRLDRLGQQPIVSGTERLGCFLAEA